ncbi:MAG: hypothetical protein ABSE48_02515 [Verrucomicrobiota bacterium]|jgi:hypothetical protein
MRALILTFGVLLIAAPVQMQALESDVYSINKPPVPGEALVSFSIGYPKGWRVMEDPRHQQTDVYYDVVGPIPSSMICAFWPTNISSATSYVVWRTEGASNLKAAEHFLASVHQLGLYKEKIITAVRTSTGDSGCLVECEADLENNIVVPPNLLGTKTGVLLSPIHGVGRVVSHDYFFRGGEKGCIRISIVTQTVDLSSRSELDQMVLKTLRFHGA